MGNTKTKEPETEVVDVTAPAPVSKALSATEFDVRGFTATSPVEITGGDRIVVVAVLHVAEVRAVEPGADGGRWTTKAIVKHDSTARVTMRRPEEAQRIEVEFLEQQPPLFDEIGHTHQIEITSLDGVWTGTCRCGDSWEGGDQEEVERKGAIHRTRLLRAEDQEDE
jgi:hypothetical protein